MLQQEQTREDVALTVPPGPRDRPAASGIAVLASLPCSHPVWQLLPPVPQASSPPGETCVFHGLLSQVSVVSDETRSVSRGSPAGLRQVTV